LLIMHAIVTQDKSLLWRKAKRSIGNGDCVEIAANTQIAVRDSKDPAGPVLRYSPDSWRLFLSEARRGTFDQLLSLASLRPMRRAIFVPARPPSQRAGSQVSALT
jgi:hypothetical protein